jgi:hypothetical protein
MRFARQKNAKSNLWAWLDAAPLLWLLLVLSAYLLLAMQPIPRDSRLLREEVRGVVELERWVLPLLAALVAGAILRYLHGRGSGPTPDETASPGLRSEAEAVQSS